MDTPIILKKNTSSLREQDDDNFLRYNI